MDAEKRREERLTEHEVIAAVRWRFRICNYLFRLGILWVLVGYAGLIFKTEVEALFMTVLITGFGIFLSAFALTLAIYRCPVCDRYISRFRPSKQHCGKCGAKIR